MNTPKRLSQSRTVATLAWLASSVLAAAAFACGEDNECRDGRLERADLTSADKTIDAATGRDLRHFPPDCFVDFKHMKLEMRFETMDHPGFTAIETLSFSPIAQPLTALVLDAVDVKISAVTMNGRAIEHFHDGERLTLRFDPGLADGDEAAVVFEYACERPWTGMIFTPPSPEAPGYLPEMHTQGEAQTNRHWFIGHDFPNERMTTELIVDVPADQSVSSNGRLVSRSEQGERAVWHYLQDKPHAMYLVSLVIGQFDIVKLPHARVPMQVWVPRGKGPLVEQCYGKTGAMIDVLEQRFGVPYPWDRYDQLVVKNFGAGGMENTSATTLYPTAILDEIAIADKDLENLISHEVAHQWAGDLITCKSWAHIWLNEGWATYGTALWHEANGGEEAYLDVIDQNFDVADADEVTDELPMVSPIYKDPWEVFRRDANPYSKGLAVLHMLRMMLGEETFWKGVHLYMQRHQGGLVETNDLRYAMEQVSGRGLEWFFEQWCYRPGSPRLDIKIDYDGATRELTVGVEQTQPIDARTPAFRLMLPVWVRTERGDSTHDIQVSERSSSFRTTLDGPPLMICVDPKLQALKLATVEKPKGMWLREATEAPTVPARRAAIKALAAQDSTETIALLASLGRDESVRWSLRQNAIESLAAFGSDQAHEQLLALINDGIAHPRVRKTAVESLRKLPSAKVIALLAQIAASDSSYLTRAAAIDGLAHFKAKEHADLIVAQVAFQSQHDDVRQAALKALAALDDPRGLDLGMQYAAYGSMDRARPTAIETVAKLASHDKDTAVKFLLELLDDPEIRTVRAAGAGLAEVGDERALQPLQSMAATHPNPRLREDAAGWATDLQHRLNETAK